MRLTSARQPIPVATDAPHSIITMAVGAASAPSLASKQKWSLPVAVMIPADTSAPSADELDHGIVLIGLGRSRRRDRAADAVRRSAKGALHQLRRCLTAPWFTPQSNNATASLGGSFSRPGLSQ